MDDCIFCKIVSGEFNSDRVFQDDQVTAFRDIHPAAPTHILIVPNKHISGISEMNPEDEALVGHLFSVAKNLAEAEGIASTGYRLIINNGADAGQVVPHLHLHLLGGHRMHHPMG